MATFQNQKASDMNFSFPLKKKNPKDPTTQAEAA